MDIKILNTPFLRTQGAMFRKFLGETILLFIYSQSAPRLFHTFNCPPLRIIALDDDGEVLFDRVTPTSQFVRLPASRLVLEMDPDHPFSLESLQDLVSRVPEIQMTMET